MAKLIRTDGTTKNVRPANGRDFQLDEMYRILNCSTIEIIKLPNGELLVLDEDAKNKEPVPPVNPDATRLAYTAGILPWDFVVGDVLLTSNEEIK